MIGRKKRLILKGTFLKSMEEREVYPKKNILKCYGERKGVYGERKG